MISDIIRQKHKIFSKLPEFGIDLADVQALLLTGSHYWGYDGAESDIDIILIDKTWKERQPIKFDKVSIEIITHTEALKRNASESNWQKFYLPQFCSYPIYGEVPKLTFNHENIVKYFNNKRATEVDMILERPIKEGFHNVMRRVFYLNYRFNDIHTFKLTDYKFCKQLDEETKDFLEEQYVLLFNRKDNTTEAKQRLKDLCIFIEDYIKENT